MRIALDNDGKRTFIEEATLEADYFCPRCKEKLIQKRGPIYAHHFAHFPNRDCIDHYHYEEMSIWHSSWQDQYKKDEQEVIMHKNGQTHIADVYIEEHKTVIEFQHSPLSYDEFKDRNTFYSSLGNRVVWIFDMREEFEDGRIENIHSSNTKFHYLNPKKTFKNLNLKENKLHLFFQIKGDDYTNDVRLIKINWISKKGMFYFCGDEYNRESFDDFINEKKKEIIINKGSVPYYWSKENCKAMILLNKNEDYKYLFTSDPIQQIEKYNSVYAKRENSFGEFKDKSIKVNDYNSPIWKPIWFKSKD